MLIPGTRSYFDPLSKTEEIWLEEGELKKERTWIRCRVLGAVEQLGSVQYVPVETQRCTQQIRKGILQKVSALFAREEASEGYYIATTNGEMSSERAIPVGKRTENMVLSWGSEDSHGIPGMRFVSRHAAVSLLGRQEQDVSSQPATMQPMRVVHSNTGEEDVQSVGNLEDLPPLKRIEVIEYDYWRSFTLSLINASRAEYGLSPVGIDGELNELSQMHANDAATHYDEATAGSRRATYILHLSSDGRTLRDRVKDRDITGASVFGENVGLRFSSGFGNVHTALEEAIRYMHEYMMAEVPPEDGHRVTILTPNYTHVGVGLELHKKAGETPNTLFLVTNFAKFIDGREVVIPAVGKRPVSPPFAPFPKQEKIENDPEKRKHIHMIIQRDSS